MTTTSTTPATPHPTGRKHPVATFTTLERACRTAIKLMRGGIDGRAVGIRVDDLHVVEPRRRRRLSNRALAEAAGRTAIIGAAAGGILAIMSGGSVLPWAVAAAVVAAAVGVTVAVVRAVAEERRSDALPPLLGARRFVVQCDEAHIDTARRIVG